MARPGVLDWGGLRERSRRSRRRRRGIWRVRSASLENFLGCQDWRTWVLARSGARKTSWWLLSVFGAVERGGKAYGECEARAWNIFGDVLRIIGVRELLSRSGVQKTRLVDCNGVFLTVFSPICRYHNFSDTYIGLFIDFNRRENSRNKHGLSWSGWIFELLRTLLQTTFLLHIWMGFVKIHVHL